MTLGPDRMMYADGFLLPHGAACFQDKLCYPFSCLLFCLKRQSYRLFCQQVGWHLFLIPVSASQAKYNKVTFYDELLEDLMIKQVLA